MKLKGGKGRKISKNKRIMSANSHNSSGRKQFYLKSSASKGNSKQYLRRNTYHRSSLKTLNSSNKGKYTSVDDPTVENYTSIN